MIVDRTQQAGAGQVEVQVPSQVGLVCPQENQENAEGEERGEAERNQAVTVPSWGRNASGERDSGLGHHVRNLPIQWCLNSTTRAFRSVKYRKEVSDGWRNRSCIMGPTMMPRARDALES